MPCCRGNEAVREDLSVLDLTSLMIVAGLFLGLVVGDAALFGDPVQVQISVPSKLSDTGFTVAAAEQVFAAQVADMGQANSIVQTPSVQVSTGPTILAALAKPLGLDNVVVAIQSQAGVDVVTVHGAVMAGGTGNQLDMTMVVSIPREVPVQIRLSQADGDATALVQHAAESAMEFVSPYRLALTHFSRGLGADTAPLKRAKAVTMRALARTWNASRATEQVMLHNLAAMMALLDNDDAEARAQFALADAIPKAAPAAYGVVALNRCFLAVSSRQTAVAERYCAAGTAMTAGLQLPGWHARVKTLDALVAWSRGDLAQAEAGLREAIAEVPDNQAPHAYLAQLLDEEGLAEKAAAERATAGNLGRLEVEVPAQAQSLYWVDPVKGGMRRRN
jgi:hypothetical protein